MPARLPIDPARRGIDLNEKTKRREVALREQPRALLFLERNGTENGNWRYTFESDGAGTLLDLLRTLSLRFRFLWGRLRGMELVFQYGSNCSVERLNGPTRLNGAARAVGIAETVEDYSLVFDVWSDGNRCAASDIVRTPGHRVWGVLYEIPRDFVFGKRTDKRKTLEQIEGAKYQPIRVRIRQKNGAELEALTFVVRDDDKQEGLRTSAEYLGHIVRGLREQGVSEDYIATVKGIAVANNPTLRDAAQQL